MTKLTIIGAESVVFTKNKDMIYHAALLDSLTASTLSIDEIYKMTDELIEAHGTYLPKHN